MSRQLQARLMNMAVRKELERLSVLDSFELMALPSIKEGETVVDGTAIPFIIWHDLLPSGEHRIVVQANRRAWLGLGVYLDADGFAVTASGSLRSLTDEELDSFM